MEKRKRGRKQPAEASMEPEACRRIRTEVLKVTQDEFARRLGVQPLTIVLWENGKTPISKSRALAITALAYQAGAPSTEAIAP